MAIDVTPGAPRGTLTSIFFTDFFEPRDGLELLYNELVCLVRDHMVVISLRYYAHTKFCCPLSSGLPFKI